MLDRRGVVEIEPTLGIMAERIAGAIYCPTDESGSCHKFTRALADICRARGAELRTGVEITGITIQGDAVSGVTTSDRFYVSR